MDSNLRKYEQLPAGSPQQGVQPLPAYPVQYADYQPVLATQQSASNVTVVTQGPQQWQQTPLQAKPNNFLPLSIINMLCCCFIFGLIALIYSLQVDSSYNVGDYEGARRAAGTAKVWNIVGLVIGIAAYAISAISIVVTLIVVFAEASAAKKIIEDLY